MEFIEGLDDQIFNELTGKAKCIHKKLQELSNGFKNAIKKFNGQFPVAHLKFREGDLGASRARTIPPDNGTLENGSPDYVITIEINNNTTNNGVTKRPNLLVAKTIAHEVIHAEMFRKLLSLAKQGHLDFTGWSAEEQTNYMVSIKENFPGIYDYYRRHKDWQHAQMATHYRKSLASILQEYDTGSPVINNQPQQRYMDLAWEGLRYPNISTWSNLPQHEKDRINDVIADYISNHGNEICTE